MSWVAKGWQPRNGMLGRTREKWYGRVARVRVHRGPAVFERASQQCLWFAKAEFWRGRRRAREP
eukprot:1292561-Lingulodinium_polyedra.AAC.1